MAHAAIRLRLHSLLGDLPERTPEVRATTVFTERRDTYVLEKLVLEANGIEPVPAYFTRPVDLKEPAPVLLYFHAHGGEYLLGKEELTAGRASIQDPPYAEVAAANGWCAFCADAWGFGERATRPELDIFKDMLWRGRVMWGMMVFDSLRALDYLHSRRDVDASRIATVGLSMGSTMSWWVAALDERVKVCVDICCLTDYQALLHTGGLDRHGVYYYVPGLLKHFTTSQINALIAPRPHLSLARNLDPLTPPEGLDRIDRELRTVYGDSGAWRLFRQDVGHLETPEMRREIIEWLGGWL